MDKQNNHTDPNWLDDVLGTKHTPKELGPDEIAVAAAGLSRPDEAELEKIIKKIGRCRYVKRKKCTKN